MDSNAWESVSRLVRWLIAWVVVGVLFVHFAGQGLASAHAVVVVIHGLFASLARTIPLNGS